MSYDGISSIEREATAKLLIDVRGSARRLAAWMQPLSHMPADIVPQPIFKLSQYYLCFLNNSSCFPSLKLDELLL